MSDYGQILAAEQMLSCEISDRILSQFLSINNFPFRLNKLKLNFIV
jgi:hypothetical protein